MVAQLDPTFVRLAPGRALSRLTAYSLFEGRPLTTKGRRWNRAVFWNLRSSATGPVSLVDRPIFIVGMGRSGTTLLGRILATHPTVGFLNEPKALWHVVRGDEDIIGSYGPPGIGRLYLDAADAEEDVAERARALYSRYLRLTRSGRVVDKYPELIFRRPFVVSIFPDARFLIAARPPGEVLGSVAAWSTSHGRPAANWWGVRDQKWRILWEEAVLGRTANSDIAALNLRGRTDDYLRAAVEWVVTMREAVPLAQSYPNAMLVRHDELVRRPRELIRNVLDFCELPASARTQEYAAAIVEPGQTVREPSISSSVPQPLSEAVRSVWHELRG